MNEINEGKPTVSSGTLKKILLATCPSLFPTFFVFYHIKKRRVGFKGCR
jgi:hypothetical protein